jgi:hypothetical protein
LFLSGSSETFLACDGWRGMADDPGTLRACLYRLADFVEQARLLPLEDRARLECMIAQARQAVCEARQGKQQLLERRETTRAIVLRLLAKEAHRKAELRIMKDDIST